MHAVEVGGTFAGHVFPGSLFVAWAFLWLAESVHRPPPAHDAPLERGSLLPALKVVLPLVGVWLELPNSGWFPADAMLGWQHITMYVAFALTGVVDVLVRGGRLSHGAGHVAYGGAMLNAGILFWGHGQHGGVPGVAHTLLALLFFASATLPLVELAVPGRGVEWLRKGSLLALGSWFVLIAWILYRSEWEMADPVREGWTYLLFSSNAIAVAVAVTALRLSVGVRTQRGSVP